MAIAGYIMYVTAFLIMNRLSFYRFGMDPSVGFTVSLPNLWVTSKCAYQLSPFDELHLTNS